jgi:4,5:9,10-diseco-3-hydroxy-5,9,17-trioxoandrosta-1(10),2-diene-4-oate hydrolase
VAGRGGSVHLVERGARDAEPLLFVHGWGVSSAAFGAFLDRLAGHYRVIAPDLPGFGRSPAPKGAVSYEAYADVLAGVLDGLGIARAHVAGLSMGGGIALTFAARHPERVRALVLMAPAGCPDVSLPRLACNRIVELAEQALSPAHAHGKALVARTFAANLLRHPASLVATVRMVASRNIVEEARRIAAPTLLLWGARDRTIPPRLAPEFIERMPGATLHVMPDSFHEMATARPEDTARIIHDFIDRAQA